MIESAKFLSGLETDAVKLVRELSPRSGDQPPSFVDRVPGTEACAPGRERDAIDVERLLEQVEVGDERLVDDCIPESEPRQAVQLREAA